MDLDLKGRVALVTGAASGIGRATAEVLAGMGARLVVSDIAEDAGAAAARALRDAGAEARFVAADDADEHATAAIVAAAVDAYGRLDLAANCAGVGGGHAPTHEYPVDAWDRIVAVNLRGTWLSMRAEIPALLRTGGGAIVNVPSTLIRPLPRLPRGADRVRPDGPDGDRRRGRERDRVAALGRGAVRHRRGADRRGRPALALTIGHRTTVRERVRAVCMFARRILRQAASSRSRSRR